MNTLKNSPSTEPEIKQSLDKNDNKETDNKSEKRFFKDKNPFPLIFLVFLIFGVLIIPVFAIQAKEWSTFFSIIAWGVAFAGASLMVGALIGFLFGIPRKLQDEQGVASDIGSQEEFDSRVVSALYGGNTNLEQISDWLTKILVGVGLTQISSLGELLKEVMVFSESGFGGFTYSGAFSVSILATSSIYN